MHPAGNVARMLNDLPAHRIAPALRFLAAEAKVSQQKLATKVGMSTSAVNRRMSGAAALTVEDLEAFSKSLGYTVTVTFTENDSLAGAA